MAVSPELSAQLRLLAAGAVLDGDPLSEDVADLVSYVQQAVPSYVGMRLVLLDHGWPVTLTELIGAAEMPVVTSLRIGLTALADGTGYGGSLVFWATATGAFVDLAADLSHALGLPVTTPATASSGPRFSSPIELDVVSLPAAAVSALDGLTELSIINQAIGSLIEQGHLPDEAHEVIRQGAAAAGLAPHLFAARLLPSDESPS